MLKPTHGIIKTLGETPNSSRSLIPGLNVGYMPQEIALHNVLTIRESMLYYGKLNFYDKDREERVKTLVDLLKLPDKNQLVGTLSGGQKRRTSLAVALFHEPPLLILDEPTVGVDPVLRKQIWDHLRECISERGQTIVITTHYINEAKYADCVGFMRNKRLLVEDNPFEILSDLDVQNLEEAFWRLSNEEDELMAGTSGANNQLENEIQSHLSNLQKKKQQKIDQIEMNELDQQMMKEKPKLKRQTYDYNGDLLRNKSALALFYVHLFALVWRNFMFMKRNIKIVLIQFVIPISETAMVYYCLSNKPYNIPIAIFNQDSPPIASQMILDEVMPGVLDMHFYDTLDDAIDSVKMNENWAGKRERIKERITITNE